MTDNKENKKSVQKCTQQGENVNKNATLRVFHRNGLNLYG
jgi:hypothetical protein